MSLLKGINGCTPLTLFIGTLTTQTFALISQNKKFIEEVNKLRASNGTLNGFLPFLAPFHVSIQVQDGKHKYKHLCGGSIIHKQVVMTAAHCFYERHPTSSISVVAGLQELSMAPTPRYKVSRVLQHPFYAPLRGCDIALVKLSQALPIDGIKLDTIDYHNTNNVKDNIDGYLIGWGHQQKNLEIIDFTTVNSKECRQLGFSYISGTDICAYSQHGRGACDGDSGGALLSTNLTKQYGLLSYGKSTCKRNHIYVYTSMFRMMDWIDDNIKKLLRI